MINTTQLNVGLDIKQPKTSHSIILIKSARYSEFFGKPVDSVMIFDDKLLKTKDTHGEITLVAPSDFGFYMIPPLGDQSHVISFQFLLSLH